MIGALVAQIQDEARRIWCFKWLALSIAALFLLAGAPIVMSLPKVYESWAQIYVAKDTPLASAAQGVSLVGEGYGDPYVVEKTLLNDESLENLLHRLDPATRTFTRGQTALAIKALKGKIRVSPSVDDGFLEVHVVDTDPVRARNIAQWLIDEFLTRNLNRNQKAIGEATRFLDEQISAYRQMLADSDARQASFRAQHPSLAMAPAPILSAPTATGQFTPPVIGGPAAPNPATAMLAQANEKAATLDARLTALRGEYTDEHPDVVAARRQLDAALSQRAEIAMRAGSPPAPSIAPVRRFHATPGRRLRTQPTASPEVKAAWADLYRTNLMLRTNYDQLVARREGARMSEAAYAAGAGKYQVTRPPTVPQLPTGPNRKLYLAAVVLLAGVAGVACAFAYAAVKGIFVSPREMEAALGLPVVGTVSWEPAWSTKRSKAGPFGRSARRRKLGPERKLSLSYGPAPTPWGGP